MTWKHCLWELKPYNKVAFHLPPLTAQFQQLPGRVGEPPLQPVTNVTVNTAIPLITLSIDGRVAIIPQAKQTLL